MREKRGYSDLKEEALDCIKWRNRFGRGCGPVVWQITDEWIREKVFEEKAYYELASYCV
jgi:formylmethanofuran dehydrogenase subunit E-like metal-binding protein